MENIGIIVLGGHIQSLGILRILGREKIPGIIIDNTSKNIARHSIFCKKFYCIKDEVLLEFLLSLAEKKLYNKWVIFPSNDYHVKLLSQNKEKLNEYFIVSTDSWEKIRIFYNKRETYKLAQQLTIPIASTFFINNEVELSKISLNFPCIIKPAVMHDFYKKVKKKVLVCQNREDLVQNYRKASKIIPPEEIIIQDIIPGPSKNQYSACFLHIKNYTHLWITACRMRQHPLDFGNATTYAETVSILKIKEYGERLLKEVGYTGLCEVEFKLDERDNDFKLLEVNPRTWKWHSIANKTGTPFLKEFYRYLIGNKIKSINSFQEASFYHFLTDFPVRLQLLFKGYSYWNRRIVPVENAVWAGDDPKPWFFEKLYLFYYILKR